MIVVPFEPSRGAYEFTTRIDDAEYLFAVRWNAHPLGGWYFDIADEAGVAESPIRWFARGLKIVLGCAIGRTNLHPLFVNGQLVAYDTTRQGREATFDDLGTRVIVVYWSQDDLLAHAVGGNA